MAHRARLSRIKTGDWAWPFRGPRLERVSPSRHLMHCRVCFLGGRKGHFSPLTSALRHDPRNACPSPRLPAAGRSQSAPSATYRIQLRHYALKSRPTSPPNSSDVHAAHNLDQIEKIDEMSDAVGLGIGNPLLDGPDQRYARLREAALARTKCGGLAPIRMAAANSHRGMAAIAVRGGIADIAQLRLAAPLPETADELCDVARMLGAAESDVLLGARSAEPEIVRMSEEGGLRDYRVLHFATHGALAGEATGSAEPGLLLTPPAQASET